MSYKVIRAFADTTDKGIKHPNGFPYEVGDTYPREGHKPGEDFLQSLCDGSNTTGSIFLVYSGKETEPAAEESTVEEPTEEKPKSRRTRKKEETD